MSSALWFVFFAVCGSCNCFLFLILLFVLDVGMMFYVLGLCFIIGLCLFFGFVIDLVFLSSIILKRRTPTHNKKGDTNDEHTHRRNNTTPNQAPIIQNKEHSQQQRTWNQTQERTRTTLNVFLIIVLVLCFCFVSRNGVFVFDSVLWSCCW